MKKICLTVILILISNVNFANPNAVISLDAHYDTQNRLVTPDKILLVKAIRAYQDGYNKSALTKFYQAAAFGNSDAHMYIGLMYLKSLGVNQDWAKGYAWIKLAALDESKKHVELRDSIYTQLKPSELQRIEFEFGTISKDYDASATLQRRDRWVKKQKRKTLGSRTGSQTSNVQSQNLNGSKLDNNRTGRLNEMEAFVDNYNFGIISSGEIIPVGKIVE